MKLSPILRRQHIGFMFKKHWIVQGKRVPIDSGVEEHLKSLNIPVVEANEFVKEKVEYERLDIVGMFERPKPLDENHPEWKARPCFTLKHSNMLLEGISQAQVLTKTQICQNSLPQEVEELSAVDIPEAIHDCVKKTILSANVYDCEQEKLPKITDPERPAVNFKRVLGITDKRRNIILTNKMLSLIERAADNDVTLPKCVVNDAECTITLEKEADLLQFQEVSNILITSNRPLKYTKSNDVVNLLDIPELYPVKHTVTLTPEHFYRPESVYPISPRVGKKHPHTTWVHFNRSQCGNIYESPVTDRQILGRGLIHTFTVAAAYAKQLYGDDVKDLPEPLYLNCIQTDGSTFHLGVLELNTLDVAGSDGTKNVWHCKNDLKLYKTSKYLSGIPVLENYNPKIFNYINALYNS